jgi:hypothetical protein
MTESIVAIAHRVKRATTNRDVLALCDHVLSGVPVPVVVPLPPRPRFDKRAYQREYMRKLRSKGKAGATGPGPSQLTSA